MALQRGAPCTLWGIINEYRYAAWRAATSFERLRLRILGAVAHPTASWVSQAAKHLVMDLGAVGCGARFIIRDRDCKFPALFDAVLADTGIQAVLGGIRTPRLNSITERWAQTCRRELLDRTLIWNQRQLLHTLREFEQFYNGHRPTKASRMPPHSSAARAHR